MFQIIFNEISAAEISALPTLQQLEVLNNFQVSPSDLEELDEDRFGRIEREGQVLYRYRADDVRIYFAVIDEAVVVHRVLTKGTFSDFLYRATKIPVHEDEDLGKNKSFWELIEAGENARRV